MWHEWGEWAKLMERDHFENVGVDGNIILTLVVKE
jgi:hypothetical protein